MDDRQLGTCLLAAQAACLGALLLPGRRLWPDGTTARAIASCLVATGAGVAGTGAATLGRRLRARPEPPPDAVLRTGGVYRAVRHPIYVGLVTAAAGVAVARARPASWVATGALAAVLRAKAVHEEAALGDRFGPEYARYRQVTPRWIPSRTGVALPRG